MAQPTTELNRFRDRASGLIDSLRQIDPILAVVEDVGTDDAARQAFFESAFVGNDITWAEFAAAVVALRNIRTARETNKVAISKLAR